MNNRETLLAMLLQGMPVRVVEKEKPEIRLSPDESELAYALVKITQRHGKFNEDYTGVWAGYDSPAENPESKIGVKCSNCVLYEGGSDCKIIAEPVHPDGKCRFAVIPDGVVKSYKD